MAGFFWDMRDLSCQCQVAIDEQWKGTYAGPDGSTLSPVGTQLGARTGPRNCERIAHAASAETLERSMRAAIARFRGWSGCVHHHGTAKGSLMQHQRRPSRDRCERSELVSGVGRLRSPPSWGSAKGERPCERGRTTAFLFTSAISEMIL